MISKTIIAAITAVAVIGGIIPFMAISQTQTNQVQAQTNNTNQTTPPTPPTPPSFATVGVVQDENHIVITITKNGAAPEGPIVVIPPPSQFENGTILTPGENTTGGQGNVTVITPDGNVTEVQNGNVTNVNNDNSTVIVTNENRTVTETPANVTVIDPPQVPKPSCNCTNQTAAAPTPEQAIPNVVVHPAPGQNVTVGPPQGAAENQTQTPPVANITQPAATNQTNQTNLPPQPGGLPSTNQTTGNQTTGNQTTGNGTVTNAAFLTPIFPRT